ncbi:MAG: stage III sporulation protein AE [Clostridiales bacterium]|nr:stage III sporulation protein AE [Clostridiales bacterium]
MKKKIFKKRLSSKLVFILILALVAFNSFSVSLAIADDGSTIYDISTEVGDIMDNLDTSDIDELLKQFSSEELSVFGFENIKDKLMSLIAGGEGIDFGSFLGYTVSVFASKINNFIPFIVSILAVCILFSLINAIKGKFASQSTEAIVRMACISLVTVIVFAQIINLVTASKGLIDFLKKQMDSFFPILLTLMTAIGSSRTVAVYQPAIAVLSSAVTNIITVFALPCFLLSIVFHVVGNLSEGIKLKTMAEFFSGAMKWVLGTAFFIFLAVLSIQGITASIYDNIYIRTTKLALSRYVPIIGGYLSEGYNLVISGSVLIKNGIGLSGIIILFLSVLPLVAQILMFSLSLKLIAAICEPLGSKGVCDILTGISKSVSALIAIILGFTFLYFIFLLLIVCTGNLVI